MLAAATTSSTLFSSRPVSRDSTEPAWSADGRDLVYVYREEDQWSLVLRPHGGAEEVLVSSPTRLSGPSWRPDDSLIMYWQEGDEGISLNMISTADARVGRPLTPLSYAGVARRTTRRAIRRGAYIASLPGACAYGTYYGYSLYRCGGAYYQRSGSGYVIVYF